MAYLGVLTTKVFSSCVTARSFVVSSGVVTGAPTVHLIFLKRRVPNFKAGLVGEPPATGILSGAVTTLDAPTERIIVRAYYRPNGFYIDATLTTSDGLFSFPQLDTSDAGNYFVIAFDNDSGVQYNAIIFDRLTPVG
jgi:hypothetical protein